MKKEKYDGKPGEPFTYILFLKYLQFSADVMVAFLSFAMWSGSARWVIPSPTR